jgi:ribose/xylose/arabinose/galactoside ABC-type transport system permease subunit
MSAAPATAGPRVSVDAAGARRVLARPAAPAVVFLAILLVIFGVSANGFFTLENFRGIVASVAVLGVVAVGVNQVILAGDIDISVGSMLGLCAVAVGAVSTWSAG